MINVTLANIGGTQAHEVVQLYVTFPEAANEPPRQLRGFQKVELLPGSQKNLSFNLTDRDLSIWNTDNHKWVMMHGEYLVQVGTSSTNLPLKGTIQI